MMNTVETKTELQFRFEELTLDYSQIIRSLGFEGCELDNLPEPFGDYLTKVHKECYLLDDIRGSYLITEAKTGESRKSIFAGGHEFKVGKVIRKELNGFSKLAFFVCTAGATLSRKTEVLLSGEDPVLGYVYDLVGNGITEAVGDKIQELVRQRAQIDGQKITNRYSPGYCSWDVSSQQQLFSLFGDNPSGVSLNASSLMHPIKSISGVIGIGKFVNYRDYQCELCSMNKCYYTRG